MKTEKPKSMKDYISGLPVKARKHMLQIRDLVKTLVPEAEETLSYGMPAFNLNGHYLIYFGGYRDFVSLYPAPRNNPAFKEEISAFAGGKGTIRFPLDKALPIRLIQKIIRFRLEENSNSVRKKRAAKKT